jgi:hypothetical protein
MLIPAQDPRPKHDVDQQHFEGFDLCKSIENW